MSGVTATAASSKRLVVFSMGSLSPFWVVPIVRR
jgi:hypothetical protein